MVLRFKPDKILKPFYATCEDCHGYPSNEQNSEEKWVYIEQKKVLGHGRKFALCPHCAEKRGMKR